jgi:hypothetical protein
LLSPFDKTTTHDPEEKKIKYWEEKRTNTSRPDAQLATTNKKTTNTGLMNFVRVALSIDRQQQIKKQPPDWWISMKTDAHFEKTIKHWTGALGDRHTKKGGGGG